MRFSLAAKMTLAFLFIALTASILVAVVMRLYSIEQFNRLVIEQQRLSFGEFLQEYYQVNGTWDGLSEQLDEGNHFDLQHRELLRPGDRPGSKPIRNTAAHPNRRWEFFGLADASGVVVIPVSPNSPPGSSAPAAMLASGERLEMDGEQIGTILTVVNPPDFTPAEQAFLRRTNSALWIATLGSALVALLVGLLLARSLTSPLRKLASAAESIGRGELEQQVEVKSGDEIGQLAETFNQMSRAIVHSNQQRRQMTADIAHDLRTPLTVIAGYIESMREGVLAPSRERLDLVYREIERLEGLVDDLSVLARADSGELSLNLAPVNPRDLLEMAADPFQLPAEQKEILLGVEADSDLPSINVDESRMAQVFSNLISNALRYTPAGGRIILSAEKEREHVVLSVADNGPGIRQDDLTFIFNRFYRADKSRAEQNGESGLGLAICKALVEAQGGEISVKSTIGEGTQFFIHFPALDNA